MAHLNNRFTQVIRDHADILFVVAAGDEGLNLSRTPAMLGLLQEDNVITVAAHSKRDASQLWEHSNFSWYHVDVAAPGEDVQVGVGDHGTTRASGTAYAAPYVAGLAAEIKAREPLLGPGKIKTIIMETVNRYPTYRQTLRSGGVVNWQRAMEAVAPH